MGTEIKMIKGYKVKNGETEPIKLDVRFTSDGYGERIQIADGEVTLGAGFAEIQSLIEKARKSK